MVYSIECNNKIQFITTALRTQRASFSLLFLLFLLLSSSLFFIFLLHQLIPFSTLHHFTLFSSLSLSSFPPLYPLTQHIYSSWRPLFSSVVRYSFTLLLLFTHRAFYIVLCFPHCYWHSLPLYPCPPLDNRFRYPSAPSYFDHAQALGRVCQQAHDPPPNRGLGRGMLFIQPIILNQSRVLISRPHPVSVVISSSRRPLTHPRQVGLQGRSQMSKQRWTQTWTSSRLRLQEEKGGNTNL